ncbi:ABC transporter substrate-binding protein [Amycolatopsis acidiphila]|uniref:ABC transporter substrate-binding protein n=1 Tax=Amycolatopsis acidiphila TaxID=715473 RepID=A0A558A479_9PSEU|nr:ABC transporter substrate-binding protein [Amycolatopsis acidiphila]TVT19057.1 ABC transporter substrate-binding protein [Amycolatopsis acidiphila]UIJ63699.1 ABC transporter substrate-binding protein [Amycolatopsis acidiphila]GHG67376.1 glutathione ABC transporter substrate-binding protein [Amycolatopsis acidiphila]
MRTRIQQLLALAAVALVVAACGGGGQSGGNGAAGPPQRGGSLTVLEAGGYAGAWPSGLDPATNTTGGANLSQMNAIFGGLFRLDADENGGNARVVPDLAAGYDLSPDGKTVKITLRDGVKFSDGTAFDAAAVAFNFTRDVSSTCTCAPRWPLVEQGGISTEGNAVVLKFSRPFAAVINSMLVSNVNWIASPAALQKLGPDQFKITPVGAGPFKVEGDQLSSQLSLVRNESYYKQGQPYLDKLTFKTIGGDQPAYQALQAGQAQAYEGMVTTPLIEQAQSDKRLTVTVQPPTSPYVVQLNTKTAPFDNEKAREAIYYATNVDAIRKGLFKDWYPAAQTFTGPGGLFYHEIVPGYRTYDLAKAKALVAELGGLTVDLGTLRNYVAEQANTALQSQWEAAGIKVVMHSDELNALIGDFNSNRWQAMLQTAGSWDPAAGVGVSFRFSATSPFSGVADPKLDDLLNQAAADVDPAGRDALYTQAGKYVSDNAYAPYILAFAPTNLSVRGVHGPGLTTKIPPLLVNTGVQWDGVWMAK